MKIFNWQVRGLRIYFIIIYMFLFFVIVYALMDQMGRSKSVRYDGVNIVFYDITVVF